MKSRTLAVLVCVFSCPILPARAGQEKEEDAMRKVDVLERKLAESEERIHSLRKDMGDLSRQISRLLEQMRAMETLLETAVTDEARQVMAGKVKSAVLEFLSQPEGERMAGPLWSEYWRYPRTVWSDDALWVLAHELGEAKGKRPEAVDVWLRLDMHHPKICLEPETLERLGWTEQAEQRQLFERAGGVPCDADRVEALQELGNGLIQMGRVEEGRACLERALALCPSEQLEVAIQIKALLRQTERLGVHIQ